MIRRSGFKCYMFCFRWRNSWNARWNLLKFRGITMDNPTLMVRKRHIISVDRLGFGCWNPRITTLQDRAKTQWNTMEPSHLEQWCTKCHGPRVPCQVRRIYSENDGAFGIDIPKDFWPRRRVPWESQVDGGRPSWFGIQIKLSKVVISLAKPINLEDGQFEKVCGTFVIDLSI